MDGKRTGRPKSLIVRILRYDHDDWQGQLVDVDSGAIWPFASFLQLQRLMLALADAGSVVQERCPEHAYAISTEVRGMQG